jgi:hypothetical protein
MSRDRHPHRGGQGVALGAGRLRRSECRAGRAGQRKPRRTLGLPEMTVDALRVERGDHRAEHGTGQHLAPGHPGRVDVGHGVSEDPGCRCPRGSGLGGGCDPPGWRGAGRARSLDLRSSSGSRERPDCSLGRRLDSWHLIVPEVDHRVESIVNPVTRHDFGCHFPDSPRIVGSGPDDRCRRPVIPDVQEAAGRPHTGPVALFAPFMAFEDILCWFATQRQDQIVINFPALQQVDASGGQSWLPSPSALGLNALARRHPVSACHGQSVSRPDRDLSLVRYVHLVAQSELSVPWDLAACPLVLRRPNSDAVVVINGGRWAAASSENCPLMTWTAG